MLYSLAVIIFCQYLFHGDTSSISSMSQVDAFSGQLGWLFPCHSDFFARVLFFIFFGPYFFLYWAWGPNLFLCRQIPFFIVYSLANSWSCKSDIQLLFKKVFTWSKGRSLEGLILSYCEDALSTASNESLTLKVAKDN